MLNRKFFLFIAILTAVYQKAFCFEETDVASGLKHKIKPKKVETTVEQDLPEPVYLHDEGVADDDVETDLETYDVRSSKTARSPSRPIGASLGLGLSAHAFDLKLGVQVPWKSYLSWDPYVNYLSQTFQDKKAFRWGPGLLLTAHIAIRKIFEPFVAAGGSYDSWEARNENERIDHGSSFVGHAIFGLKLNLAKHFAFVLSRRSSYFASATPLNVATGERLSDPSHITEVGFVAKL